MSRAYDAKQVALEIYKATKNRDQTVDLFLGYIDISESDFVYEFNQTPEKYIFGDDNE